MTTEETEETETNIDAITDLVFDMVERKRNKRRFRHLSRLGYLREIYRQH